MTWVVPVELEEVVYAAARDVLGDAPLATPALTRAIVDRSKRYTSDRDRLAAPTDKTADLAARAVFFTIADAMKIAIPLAELAARGAIPARRPLRVVDLGAGCGAMSLGLVASLVPEAGITGEAGPEMERASERWRSGPEMERASERWRAGPEMERASERWRAGFEITAIDRDVDALRIAGTALRALAERRNVTVGVTTRSADVETTSIPTADLVVIGTTLNELEPPARLALVERALAALHPEGALIIIEPALRDTSRALHEVRDAVLAGKLATVFAPCTRQGAPCPALANLEDWCHEDRAVTLPPRTHELARLTGLRDSGLKFSYLVLRHSQLPLVEAASAWRVVSAPMIAKGKHEIYGCSDAGRIPIRLLKRNRTDANRAFERARRGDVLVTDAAPGDERVELGKDTTLTRVEPAGR